MLVLASLIGARRSCRRHCRCYWRRRRSHGYVTVVVIVAMLLLLLLSFFYDFISLWRIRIDDRYGGRLLTGQYGS